MEKCVQCGKSQAQPYAVVAIMNMEHAPDPTAAIAESGLWMAFPICEACHQSPHVKAHFAPRMSVNAFLVAARDQVMLEG